ncbi:MAG: PIN domain-containing protein [Coriobacteriales bacterium]|jgi:predicted nucleic acid-binding protein|nr:PIN domain-containing protein [Coriobacteriales bacterium]
MQQTLGGRDCILLDTNILVDYLAIRQPFYADARKLMILGAIGEATLWVSASQLNDVFYIVSEGGKPALGPTSQERLQQCRSFIHICAVTEQDVDAALDLGWDDLEDASVYICAEKMGADFIMTRDRGFPASGIPTLDAAGYFDYLRRERGLTYEEMTLGGDARNDRKLQSS